MSAYLGSLAPGEERATEAAPRSLVELLRSERRAAPHPGLVPIAAAGEALEYRGDLRGLTPLRELSPLGAVLEALAALHAAGRVHGDLRPAHLWTGPRTVLTYPEADVDRALLLRARLREGAEPGDVDFAAPEVVAGRPATAASDVYSAAAIVHWLLTGAAPHGTPRPLGGSPGLEGAVLRALSPDPERRPALAELALALRAPAVRLVARPVAEKDRQSSLILALLLVVGGVFVVSGALWVVAMSWEALGEVGRFLLLAALTAGVGLGGFVLERRGYLRSGFALVVLWSQLLWADAAYLVVLNELEDSAGVWAFAAAVVAAIGFGLALARRSWLLAALGSIAAGLAMLFLGGALASGSRTGPAIWSAVCGAVLAGLAVVGSRRGERTGVPPAVIAVLFLAGSHLVSIDGFGSSSTRAFATLWPYGVLAALIGGGVAIPRPYGLLGLVPGVLLLSVTPSIQAFARWDVLGYLYAASAIGGGLVVLAFKWEALARDQARQLSAILAGLVSVTLPTGVLALAKLADRNGDELLRAAIDLSPVERLESPLLYLNYLVGTAVVLVGLGVLFARDAERKLPYRILEMAGLLLFFGTLTILSLARHRELLHPGVLFAGGLASLGVGAWRRHVFLVAVPSAFLVLNAWIQYFAKLSEHAPLGLLLIGFGIGLLVSGVAFEKRIRPRLKGLGDWR